MKGAVVLLTGATGFLGSVILEQFLRSSDCTIFVLVRSKGTLSAEERIANLMSNSPLFSLLRESTVDWPALSSRVAVISCQGLEPRAALTPEKKENLPDLKSSSKKWTRLACLCCLQSPQAKILLPSAASSSSSSSIIPDDVLSQITHVIHSAARIALEDNIQVTLNSNFLGTRLLLDLCSKMINLQCFTHISSAFTNINQPWGSAVQEKIYPLMLGDREVSVDEQVQKIMSLSPEAANEKAATLMKLWGFPNTYSLGKSFTERLVRGHAGHRLPSGAKIVIIRPSFIGALAGQPLPGYTGNLAGPSGAGIAYGLGFYQKGGFAWSNDSLHDSLPVDIVSGLTIAATSMAGAGHQLSLDQQPWIVHACSSTINPIFNLEVHRLAFDFFSKHPARWKIITGPYPPPLIDYVVDEARVAKCTQRVEQRVKILTWMLSLMGRTREAKKLALGLQQWKEANSTKSNIQLFFSSDAALKIERAMVREEAGEYQVVWRGSWKDWSEDYLSFVLERFMGGGKKEGRTA